MRRRRCTLIASLITEPLLLHLQWRGSNSAHSSWFPKYKIHSMTSQIHQTDRVNTIGLRRTSSIVLGRLTRSEAIWRHWTSAWHGCGTLSRPAPQAEVNAAGGGPHATSRMLERARGTTFWPRTLGCPGPRHGPEVPAAPERAAARDGERARPGDDNE